MDTRRRVEISMSEIPIETKLSRKLTQREAYAAMFSFLENYYEQTSSDTVGSLLSGLCLMIDGMPMDMAYWVEWEEAVQKSLENKVNMKVEFVK